MNEKNLRFTFIIVAILFLVLGFGLGRISKSDSSKLNKYQKAYVRGWVTYGHLKDGMSLKEQYTLGRSYDEHFKDTEEAFEAGYRDGYFFINKKDYDEITMNDDPYNLSSSDRSEEIEYRKNNIKKTKKELKKIYDSYYKK